MSNEYLDEITTLLKQVRPELATTHRLEFKNVFGAVGGYVNGYIFISHGKFGVALKLPKEVLDELFKGKDIKHLRYFPRGHLKKEYAILSKEVLENKRQLGKLVDESIKYVLSP
ncbi:MAG: hypothetical protein IIA90_03865 [Chloroflexi bacterium]|nr:hypothetical protein [Chloroflexota bacterium]